MLRGDGRLGERSNVRDTLARVGPFDMADAPVIIVGSENREGRALRLRFGNKEAMNLTDQRFLVNVIGMVPLASRLKPFKGFLSVAQTELENVTDDFDTADFFVRIQNQIDVILHFVHSFLFLFLEGCAQDFTEG